MTSQGGGTDEPSASVVATSPSRSMKVSIKCSFLYGVSGGLSRSTLSAPCDNLRTNTASSEDAEEEAPMRHSFSVEDLLDEVEKICYDASGTSKVRHHDLCVLVGQEKLNVGVSYECASFFKSDFFCGVVAGGDGGQAVEGWLHSER